MSNEPQLQDQDRLGHLRFAVRISMFVLSLPIAVIGAWCWGLHAISPAWMPGSTIAVAATGWVLATLYLLAIRPRAKWAIVALLVCCALAGMLFAPAAQRAVCGAHAIKRDSELRALVQAGLNEKASSGEIPRSFVVLAAENGYWECWSPRPCRCDGLADLVIGRYSMKDFEAGRVTLEELRAEAAQSQPGEFERLGNVTVWRNPDAWNNGLVVAWRTPDDLRWDWSSAATAELWVRCVNDLSDEFVTLEVDRAAKVGVTYPAELLDLIKHRQRR